LGPLSQSPIYGPTKGSHRYTRAELEALPVLAIGQAENLHVDDWPNRLRVWLSRAAPYVVTVERWTSEDGWTTAERYRAW